MRKLTVICFLTVLAAASLAAPPDGYQNPASDKIVDNDTYINPGNILMFVTNHGNFGRDLSDVFGNDYGTYYPFETVADIENGTLTSSVLYAAGLWIGGKVGGNVRVTTAEYDDEYVPGPMEGGSYQPDNPAFKVYKLYSDSLESNPNSDYLNWPVDQGAPIDELGKPAMLGNQMLWTVFNDADPNQHDNGAGETLPLGTEVQLTVWAFQSGGTREDVIYLKYKIYNRGQNSIQDCYFSLWTDPDLGGSNDDFVGCDTLNNLFFCYNATNNDPQYLSTPPAVGFKIICGPLVLATGQQAYFDGNIIPGFRNLGMTACAKYINGTDPDNFVESYNYMRGLNRDGTPYTYNGQELTYWHSGNPVTGTGDLDIDPSDRRVMGSMGPLNMAPGDSQYVFILMGVGQGSDRLSSVAELKYLLNTYGQIVTEPLAVMEMDTMFAYMANGVNPLMTSVFMGDFWGEYQITDVNLASLTLNGAIPLSDVSIVPSPIPEIAGDALVGEFEARLFVQGYVPLWDIEDHEFSVEGMFYDATPFTINSTVPMVGHISGDANGDKAVDILDAVYLVGFKFRGGPPPAVLGTGDPNADGEVNVLDIIYLVDFLYRGGPAPLHP